MARKAEKDKYSPNQQRHISHLPLLEGSHDMIRQELAVKTWPESVLGRRVQCENARAGGYKGVHVGGSEAGEDIGGVVAAAGRRNQNWPNL